MVYLSVLSRFLTPFVKLFPKAFLTLFVIFSYFSLLGPHTFFSLNFTTTFLWSFFSFLCIHLHFHLYFAFAFPFSSTSFPACSHSLFFLFRITTHSLTSEWNQECICMSTLFCKWGPFLRRLTSVIVTN